MRVLVSGAHGLIAGALMTRLGTEGHDVVRLARVTTASRAIATPSSAPGTGLGPATPPLGRDTVDWAPLAGVIDRRALAAAGPYDAVVHLAGAGIGDRRWSGARRQQILSSRLGPTRLLAEAMAGLDPAPRVLVSASAVGYYGDRGDEELDERSAPGTGFLAEVCRAWEAATAPAADRLRVVQLRTGIVLSSAGGALAKQLPLFRLALGGRLGSGRQYMSWITLDDAVSVIRRAIDDDALAGPLNVTTPEPVTNARFTRALATAVHRPAVLAVPRPALRVAFGRPMADELLLAGQRVLPARLVAAGHRFAHPDLDSALAAVLGH